MSIERVNYLRTKLGNKAQRVRTRYKFYEMKSIARDFQISTPPQLQWMFGSLGWCGKAVDSLADRLTVRGWSNDNFGLEDIFLMNNPDTLYDSAILSALISSCSFVYVSLGDDGFPRLQVIDGANATGIKDPITGMLSEGYAVLDRDDEFGAPTLEAYFAPGYTEYYIGDELVRTDMTGCKFPALVPIVNRPDDKRPFGHSRISRSCMSLQDSALRTIKRSEIAAEFYSYPQKYITGLAQDFEPLDKWKATMSSLIAFEKDDDGDKPVVGQFQVASMTPHLEQLKMFAALFGGETGLTLDDLGFASGNPSSADAIKSAHENLRLTARKAQRCFGSGFLNAGIVAACMRDGQPYERRAFYRTRIDWLPVFEPDGAMLGSIGDAALKIEQFSPGYMDEKKLNDLTGL